MQTQNTIAKTQTIEAEINQSCEIKLTEKETKTLVECFMFYTLEASNKDRKNGITSFEKQRLFNVSAFIATIYTYNWKNGEPIEASIKREEMQMLRELVKYRIEYLKEDTEMNDSEKGEYVMELSYLFIIIIDWLVSDVYKIMFGENELKKAREFMRDNP